MASVERTRTRSNSRRSCSQRARPLLAVALVQLEHGQDVLLDREAAEHRGLLRQVADAGPGPAVHGQAGDVLAVQDDLAAVGRDQAGDDIEAGGLAGPVGPEQAHGLAAGEVQRHVLEDGPGAVAFAQIVGTELGLGRRRQEPLRTCDELRRDAWPA